MKFYSKITEYAIRALIIMAEDRSWGLIQVKYLCTLDDLPLHFTRKALQTLTRHSILKASRGPSGGYHLNKNPKDIRLFDVIKIFDPIESLNECVLGANHCSVRKPCSLRKLWIQSQKKILKEMKFITIADLTREQL